ncbi:hypothetical protein HKCCSP123_03975 [Rhodobacterales bacterium HKCCSP123]|nr:hypothetical protein [Rhodobacterales bacterium HKCCSP123]
MTIRANEAWTDRRFTYRAWTGKAAQLGALVGIAWALVAGVSSLWWAVAAVMYFAMSCLGYAICVHRGLCHRAFVMKPAVTRVLSIVAALGLTGSPMGWIGTHRTHHAHADRPEDPHAPGDHGWWLLWTGPDLEIDWWRIRDMLRDPFQRWLHRYYLLVPLTWALLLAVIDPRAVVFGFVIPAGVHVTTSNLSTILGHGHGYRNHDLRDGSTNNALLALLTWGEGWHNNHHARPTSWSLRERWWEFDPAGQIIRLMAATGLIERNSLRTAP